MALIAAGDEVPADGRIIEASALQVDESALTEESTPAATARERSPLTRELNRLTLWIAAAAGLTMIVMFALAQARGQAWDALFASVETLGFTPAINSDKTGTLTMNQMTAVEVLAVLVTQLGDVQPPAWDHADQPA